MVVIALKWECNCYCATCYSTMGDYSYRWRLRFTYLSIQLMIYIYLLGLFFIKLFQNWERFCMKCHQFSLIAHVLYLNHVEVDGYSKNSKHWINLSNSINAIPWFSRTYHCMGLPSTIIQTKSLNGFIQVFNALDGIFNKTKPFKNSWTNLFQQNVCLIFLY